MHGAWWYSKECDLPREGTSSHGERGRIVVSLTRHVGTTLGPVLHFSSSSTVSVLLFSLAMADQPTLVNLPGFSVQNLPLELVSVIGKWVQTHSDNNPLDDAYFACMVFLRQKVYGFWAAIDLPPSSITCDGEIELDYVLKAVRPWLPLFSHRISSHILM